MNAQTARAEPPMTTQTTLFRDAHEWLSRPGAAFDAYLADSGWSRETQRVYRAMWNKLLRWMTERSIALVELRWVDLQTFLDDTGLKKAHRQRYLILVERIWTELARVRLVSVNPATQAVVRKVGRGFNAPTVFLDPKELQALANLIVAGFALDDRYQPPRFGSLEWIAARDAVLAATLLFGGLKLSEGLRLGVNCIVVDGAWLMVSPGKSFPMRRARLLEPGAEILERWRRWRQQDGCANFMLLPAAPRGPKGDRAGGRPVAMHAATAWRRVAALMAGVGIVGPRSCPQTLRNTYAGQLFAADLDDHAVMESLGLAHLSSANLLRKAWERTRAVPSATCDKEVVEPTTEDIPHANRMDDGPLTAAQLARIRAIASTQLPKGKVIRKRSLLT